MKSTIRIMTAIILSAITCCASFAKTQTMTTDRYNLLFHKVDKRIVGTWEMNVGNQSEKQPVFCQFNANGTFISYNYRDGFYQVIGKGRWLIEDNVIYILHGEEMSAPIIYEAADNRLVFGKRVSYTKLNPAYASR